MKPLISAITTHTSSKEKLFLLLSIQGFPGGSVVKNVSCLPMQETQENVGSVPGGEDPLEEKMATHSSILAWRIPWTEEPGRLQSMGSQRVKHNLATKPNQEIL